MNGPDCNCLCWVQPQEQQTVFFCHGTDAILQFPADQPLINVHLIIWPVLAGVVVLGSMILLIIYGIWRHKRRTNTRYGIMSPPEPATVFLAASIEEDEEVKRKIRHLCHILVHYKLAPVYYEYVKNDHSANSPSALGINRWAELQFSRCEFVLFVCTKRFLEEWNGERRDITSPLVYPCRNLLDSSIQHPQNINRYAVLFMDGRHRVPPLLGCLRQFDIFQLGNENIRANNLIRFLRKVRPFCPTSCSKYCCVLCSKSNFC